MTMRAFFAWNSFKTFEDDGNKHTEHKFPIHHQLIKFAF